MATNKSRWVLVAGLIFLALVGVYVTVEVLGSKDEIRVGYMRISAHAPVVAARELGFFERHNLNVKFETYGDTPSLMQAVRSGQVDVGYQLTADIVLAAAAQGEVYFIYMIVQSTEDAPIDGLYSMSDDLTSESIRGSVVGHFPGPTGAAMTKRIMTEVYGLDASEYELKPLAPPIQLGALDSGEVVALFTYEPLGTMAVDKLGAKRVIAAPVERYVTNGPWNGGIGVFSHDLVDRRPLTARQFRDAIHDATEYLEENPRVAADAIADLQPGLDEDIAAKVPLTTSIFARNKVEEAYLLEALEQQVSVYRSLGLLPDNGRANLRIFVGE